MKCYTMSRKQIQHSWLIVWVSSFDHWSIYNGVERLCAWVFIQHYILLRKHLKSRKTFIRHQTLLKDWNLKRMPISILQVAHLSLAFWYLHFILSIILPQSIIGDLVLLIVGHETELKKFNYSLRCPPWEARSSCLSIERKAKTDQTAQMCGRWAHMSL